MNGSVSILLIEDDSDHAELIQRAFEERGNGLETTARIIYDQENNATEVQASSRDITERKRSQVELQRAHEDLQDAYDKTIEGWVRALDLRDRETEGHTQRVSEMEIRLARELCCSDEELLHIMHKHPLYAYQMLSPIIYLNQALSIPYYHHERWDGTGYPHGLKGEEIPLFARLFAVVELNISKTKPGGFSTAILWNDSCLSSSKMRQSRPSLYSTLISTARTTTRVR